jgi:hypothetical protein
MEKKAMNPIAVALFRPEEGIYGTIYHPANCKAVAIKALMQREIRDTDLPLVEALGFKVLFPNGQPLPFSLGSVSTQRGTKMSGAIGE